MTAFPESLEERQELLDRHSTIRAEIDAAYEQLVERLPDEVVVETAKDLGLWRRGRLTASDNEDFVALFDVALLGDGEHHGFITEILESGGIESGSRIDTVLRAYLASRFSIFEIVGIVPDVGLELHDRVRDERVHLVTPLLSTAPDVEVGGFMVARLVELDGLTVPASTCFRMEPEAANGLLEAVHETARALGDTDFEGLNASILRAIMHAKYGAPQVPVRSTKVGRNDPCPCGSGKKYKKCCGA